REQGRPPPRGAGAGAGWPVVVGGGPRRGVLGRGAVGRELVGGHRYHAPPGPGAGSATTSISPASGRTGDRRSGGARELSAAARGFMVRARKRGTRGVHAHPSETR